MRGARVVRIRVQPFIYEFRRRQIRCHSESASGVGGSQGVAGGRVTLSLFPRRSPLRVGSREETERAHAEVVAAREQAQSNS